MVEGLNQLSEFTGESGYVSSAPKESGGHYMSAGSSNAMLTGTGKVSNFRGITKQGVLKGGFVMSNVASTYASIGQTSDVTAYGSAMNVFAALFYIGKGLVRLTGLTLGINASATLSLLIRRAGGYPLPASGPFQAGLAAPSAPVITAIAPPAGFTGKVTGTISVVIWRIRSTTGAVSNHSPVSNIVTADGQVISIQFPLVDANGQDAWGIGVTKQIEGRVGSHFELKEILETEITSAASTTDVVTNGLARTVTGATNATPIVITANAHGYVTGDKVTVAGVTGNTAANGLWTIIVVNANTFSLTGSVGNAAYGSGGTAVNMNITSTGLRTVTGATNATPIVITTSAAHGYLTGDSATVAGVGGNTAVNGTRTIVVLSSTTFSLDGSVGNGAYTSGGTVTRGFVSTYIGWTVTLSGGTPACALTTYVTAVPSANILTLAANPPTNSTGVTMALTQGVVGTARSAVIEYRDGDLLGKDFAPFRDFPPPPALFAGTLEDVLFVDGAYADSTTATGSGNPGTALAPSEPGRPESFSPDTVIFTNDTPTALLRGDGVYWRFGRNTLHTVQYLGGEKPLSMEIVWEGTGIQYQNQACLGEGGRLYLWPANRGLLRMGPGGLPEGTFATAITDDLINCTDPSKRVLGWDGISQVIAVCYDNKVWPYFTSLDKWGAPATLAVNVRSAVTDNNQLLLTDTNDDIYAYNVGAGSIMKVRTPWFNSPTMDTVAAILASVRADNIANPVVIETFADGDEITAVSSISVTPTRTGFQRLETVWPNIIDCTSHAVQVTMTSTTDIGDSGLEKLNSFGEPSNSL